MAVVEDWVRSPTVTVQPAARNRATEGPASAATTIAVRVRMTSAPNSARPASDGGGGTGIKERSSWVTGADGRSQVCSGGIELLTANKSLTPPHPGSASTALAKWWACEVHR